MRSRFHNTALMLALFAYLLFGLGGAVPLGFCIEADGRVEIEVMASGACGPFATRTNERRLIRTEPAEHCVSCNDILVPFESVVSSEKKVVAPLPVASVNDVAVPLIIAWTEPIRRVNAGPAFPELPRLSTIVIRA